MIEGYRLESLTRDRFEDLETVLGSGGIGGCWCMYWVSPTTKEWREGAKGGASAPNKSEFLAIAQEGPPPGLLAYDGDAPIAWCRVMARTRLLGLTRSRFFKTDLDIDGVWSLPCFVVQRSHRGRGLTRVLTLGAIELAKKQGATILEAYPWDPTETMDPSTIYTGVASTFAALGFEVVQRSAPHKPMMRLNLA